MKQVVKLDEVYGHQYPNLATFVHGIRQGNLCFYEGERCVVCLRSWSVRVTWSAQRAVVYIESIGSRVNCGAVVSMYPHKAPVVRLSDHVFFGHKVGVESGLRFRGSFSELFDVVDRGHVDCAEAVLLILEEIQPVCESWDWSLER